MPTLFNLAVPLFLGLAIVLIAFGLLSRFPSVFTRNTRRVQLLGTPFWKPVTSLTIHLGLSSVLVLAISVVFIPFFPDALVRSFIYLAFITATLSLVVLASILRSEKYKGYRHPHSLLISTIFAMYAFVVSLLSFSSTSTRTLFFALGVSILTFLFLSLFLASIDRHHQ